MTDKQTRRAAPVATTSAPLVAERLDALRDMVPEAFGEAGIDWDKLEAALGETVDDRPDRYRFEWAGKRDAIALLRAPSTLRSKEALKIECARAHFGSRARNTNGALDGVDYGVVTDAAQLPGSMS